MKPEVRVFEITIPTKKISLNYHLNTLSRFRYYIEDVKCDSMPLIRDGCKPTSD